MADTISEAIEETAKGPKAVTVGNQSVTQQSIDEQIKADQYLQSQNAGAVPGFGLRFQKIVPPGAG